MTVTELFTTIKESLSARRVYGDPIERDGVVVIPAAVVYGGGGGGNGDVHGSPQEGGGFGMLARPIGAFVISHGGARWVPAADYATRIGMMISVVATVWLLARRRYPMRPIPA